MKRVFIYAFMFSLLTLTSAAAHAANVCYSVHFLKGGWDTQKCDGAVSGSVGQSAALDTLSISSPGRNICYRTHSANVGWGGIACDGEVAGTTGKYIQAVKIWFWNGDSEQSVEYGSHLQNIGWTTPVYDGNQSGTTGQSRRLEALTVSFVPRRACPNGSYIFTSSGYELSSYQAGRDSQNIPICQTFLGWKEGSVEFQQSFTNSAVRASNIGWSTTIDTAEGNRLYLQLDYTNNVTSATYCRSSGCVPLGSATQFGHLDNGGVVP